MAPRAHDADRLGGELGADKAVLGLAVAAARPHLRDVAQQREHHADSQLRDRLGGVSGGVADLDPHLFGGLQVDVGRRR